jgi:hypothetical protein
MMHGGEAMAGDKSKEATYRRQLQDLGVYDPAFDPAIHVLCIQERELSRAMKAWKATATKDQAPLITDPLYQEISKLRRDILARQDALGLTPKGLQRLRKNAAPTSADAAPIAGTPNQGFAALMNKLQETAHAGK